MLFVSPGKVSRRKAATEAEEVITVGSAVKRELSSAFQPAIIGMFLW